MMCTEPTLRDLLNDPLTATIMASDGVSRDALSELLRAAASAARRDPSADRFLDAAD